MAEPMDRDLDALFSLDGGPGPAQPIEPARSAALIAAALRGAGFPPPIPGGNGSGGPQGAGSQGAGPDGAARGARHAARRAAFSSKRLLLVGGAGAIAVAIVIGLAVRKPAAPAPPASVAPAAAPAPAAQLAAAQPGPTPSESAQPASTHPPAREPDATDSAATEPPAPTGSGAGEPTRHRAPPRSSPSKLHATPSPPHRRRIPPRTAVVAAADPEDLLAEANAARLARNWRSADALYTRVASSGGGALAAQTALVASAQLHLEHLGDPDGAARRFRRALTTGARDTLAEDARWGLAEVARTTHDTAAERSALDDFLAHHAGSVRASQARARRAELEAQ